MDVTLIEVLKCLARKWNFHYQRRERRDPIWRKRCEALQDRIEHESSPIPKLQLLQEQVGVEETWSELWDSESYYNVALGTAVEWCAAHTGFGGRLIFDLAVAGFEASALKPELQSEAQKLAPALLKLPADIWRTTGWAKLVLSAQPKTPSPKPEPTKTATGGKTTAGRGKLPKTPLRNPRKRRRGRKKLEADEVISRLDVLKCWDKAKKYKSAEVFCTDETALGHKIDPPTLERFVNWNTQRRSRKAQ